MTQYKTNNNGIRNVLKMFNKNYDNTCDNVTKPTADLRWIQLE